MAIKLTYNNKTGMVKDITFGHTAGRQSDVNMVKKSQERIITRQITMRRLPLSPSGTTYKSTGEINENIGRGLNIGRIEVISGASEDSTDKPTYDNESGTLYYRIKSSSLFGYREVSLKLYQSPYCVWAKPFPLTITTTNCSVSAYREFRIEPSAKIGDLTNGSTIYYGDEIAINLTIPSGYAIAPGYKNPTGKYTITGPLDINVKCVDNLPYLDPPILSNIDVTPSEGEDIAWITIKNPNNVQVTAHIKLYGNSINSSPIRQETEIIPGNTTKNNYGLGVHYREVGYYIYFSAPGYRISETASLTTRGFDTSTSTDTTSSSADSVSQEGNFAFYQYKEGK